MIDNLPAHKAAMRERILNPTADGTIELRTDVKIVRYPDRFTDSRGTELWETVLKLLTGRRQRQEAAAREAG